MSTTTAGETVGAFVPPPLPPEPPLDLGGLYQNLDRANQALGRPRSILWLSVIGRLKDGITIDEARAQLQSFWPELLLATASTETPGPRELCASKRMIRQSYFPTAGNHHVRSEEHTSELQSQSNLVCRLLLEKKKKQADAARGARPAHALLDRCSRC